MTKLTTKRFRSHIGNQLIEAIIEPSNTEYYVFVNDHTVRTEIIPTPTDNERVTSVDAYRNMIFGKRLQGSDMRLMIRNIPWVAGSTFTMYDDLEVTIFDKEFFCVVNEFAFRHVYKCLDNNSNTESTSQPDFSHITGANTNIYRTSDGFSWKYMYSISAANYDKFATSAFIPVFANSTVATGATRAALDVIKITASGKNYNNYTAGTFLGADIRVGGNTLLYIVSNTTLQTTNGFYTGCLLYLNAGTGAGQFKTIDNYFSNSTASFAVINNAFSIPPENGTTFSIDPLVEVVGDGFQSTNAVARGLVNALSTNSIYRVEMIERGVGYFYATANVIANAVVGVTSTSTLRPIYSPADGHGFDAATELGSEHIGIGINFSNTEGNTIPTENTFEQIGILKDPLFANVGFDYINANGTFTDGELLYKITPTRFNINATVNTTSTSLSCSTADFTEQIDVGDQLYLKSGNSLSHMITTVTAITNATHINIASNGNFACTETFISLANSSSTGYLMTTANSTLMYVANVSGVFSTGDIYIGNASGAKAEINTIIRNSITKGFNTFVQLHKYTGTLTSGEFVEDETLFQGSSLITSTANSSLFSAIEDGGTLTILTSNQVGIFSTSEAVIGNTSSATAAISAQFGPELVLGSGEVLSLENIDSVARGDTKTETLKLIFNFGE